jgi:hypothetical protein
MRLGWALTAFVAAVPACRPAGTAAPPPVNVAAPAPADDFVLAADAGTYMAFSISGAGDVPPAITGWRAQQWEMFGANVLDTDSAAVIGTDPQRPVVLSSAIVDPARLRELLASAKAPPLDAPFTIRLLLVMPVLDPARAQAALDVLMRASVCARPRGDQRRWAALLARLSDPNDRRTAESSDAMYLCLTDLAAIVVRMNVARRELRWAVASGHGSLLASAAAPMRPARELGARLQREGFFSARAALFKAPAESAREAIALSLIKSKAGVAGVDPSQRDRLWQKGAHEASASQRLIDSPPILFAGLLAADGALSWTLTKEGREFFSSLPAGSLRSTKSLKDAIAKNLKPGGVFTDARRLSDEIHAAGSAAELFVRFLLWPHILAVAAAHPGAISIATDFDNESAQVEIDIEAGRVRLRLGGAR